MLKFFFFFTNYTCYPHFTYKALSHLVLRAFMSCIITPVLHVYSIQTGLLYFTTLTWDAFYLEAFPFSNQFAQNILYQPSSFRSKRKHNLHKEIPGLTIVWSIYFYLPGKLNHIIIFHLHRHTKQLCTPGHTSTFVVPRTPIFFPICTTTLWPVLCYTFELLQAPSLLYALSSWYNLFRWPRWLLLVG